MGEGGGEREKKKRRILISHGKEHGREEGGRNHEQKP
jgi:hypothetical protein